MWALTSLSVNCVLTLRPGYRASVTDIPAFHTSLPECPGAPALSSGASGKLLCLPLALSLSLFTAFLSSHVLFERSPFLNVSEEKGKINM